jgi:hypothetical protein
VGSKKMSSRMKITPKARIMERPRTLKDEYLVLLIFYSDVC